MVTALSPAGRRSVAWFAGCASRMEAAASRASTSSGRNRFIVESLRGAADYRMRPGGLSAAGARMLLRIAIFSAGKTLTDPLLVILTLVAILLFFAARRTSGNARRLIVLSILLTIALWLLSTPLVSGLLTRSLFITPDATDVAP